MQLHNDICVNTFCWATSFSREEPLDDLTPYKITAIPSNIGRVLVKPPINISKYFLNYIIWALLCDSIQTTTANCSEALRL